MKAEIVSLSPGLASASQTVDAIRRRLTAALPDNPSALLSGNCSTSVLINDPALQSLRDEESGKIEQLSQSDAEIRQISVSLG